MKKCVFAAEVCVHYQMGKGGIRPEDSRIRAILAISQPKIKQDVWVFLEMTVYYRCFIRDYATIIEPLTILLKKGSPEEVLCEARTELVFQKLKQLLVSSPLMQNPDFTRAFVMQTDACLEGSKQ